MQIDREDVTRILAELVRIPSINPAFSEGRTNESAVAECVGAALGACGFRVLTREPEPGRVTVVGTRRGHGGGPSLLLYAHSDTVGVEGMADPFAAEVRGGRLYGRGAYDMKAGLAACLAAARAIAEADVPLAGDLLVAAVADEEVASLGMIDLLRHVRPDGAIVTEPTELELCLAHKGFCWVDVETRGKAAHGSRFDQGIDANLRMGHFLARLSTLERSLRARAPHPLVGPPSLHAALLRGGSGESTYAANCRLTIERRTVPGETERSVLEEVRSVIAGLAEEDPGFEAEAGVRLARAPFESDAARPLGRTVAAAAEHVVGRRPPIVGRPFWMDAAFLAEAGVDTVVFGPAGEGAHADVEWVDLDSVVAVACVLAESACRYCGLTDADRPSRGRGGLRSVAPTSLPPPPC